jgi:hypothetical protein
MQMQISWSMPLHVGWLLDVSGEKGRLARLVADLPDRARLHAARRAVGRRLETDRDSGRVQARARHCAGLAKRASAELPDGAVDAAMVEAIHGGATCRRPTSRGRWKWSALQEAIRVSSA